MIVDGISKHELLQEKYKLKSALEKALENLNKDIEMLEEECDDK